MATTVNEILGEVLALAPAVRAALAEKIVESIEADIDTTIERAHLDEIKRRRQQVVSGETAIIPGDEVLRNARSLIKQ